MAKRKTTASNKTTATNNASDKADKKSQIAANLIAEEEKEMLKLGYEFETEKVGGRELVKLTRKNVARAEAVFRNDSAYFRGGNRDGEPTSYTKGKNEGKVKYVGSSAYWMIKLKDALTCENQVSKDKYGEIIESVILALDGENGTHLNSDRVGWNKIKERILGFSRKELFDCLRNPLDTKYILFNAIAETTAGKKGERGRRNLSFASKFCHYACFYIFEGKKWQDNYSIYDSVLKKVLPWYLEKYKIAIQKTDLEKYETYCEAITKLLEKVRKEDREEISRNGLDHLLWQFHKGRSR